MLASTVSAFYPYVPDYECIEDGSCPGAPKRGLSNELAEAIGKKGTFEVKLKSVAMPVCLPTFSKCHGHKANAE